MNLFAFRDRLMEFDLLEEVRQVIIDTGQNLVNFNQEQLYEGIRSDSSTIEPEYAELTKIIKAAKGQPFDRVTLKDTGDFYDSIKVDVNSDTFELFATDEKTVKLVTKYGDSILGITDSSKRRYINEIFRPRLEDVITAKLLI